MAFYAVAPFPIHPCHYLPLPRAAIGGAAPHPGKRGRPGGAGVTKGTCPPGLTAASACGVWGKPGLTSMRSTPLASSSAILRETDARSQGQTPGLRRAETCGRWQRRRRGTTLLRRPPEWSLTQRPTAASGALPGSWRHGPGGREGFPCPPP